MQQRLVEAQKPIEEMARLARESVWRQSERLLGDPGGSLAKIVRLAEESARRQSEYLERLARQFEESERAYQQLPARNRAALHLLAAKGWYMDADWSPADLFEVAGLFEAGDDLQAHAELCEYFDHNAYAIEERARPRFPHRARILQQAFAAHRRAEYAMSIPAMLAQADGVCRELIGVQAQRHEEIAGRLAEKGMGDYGLSCAAALSEPAPLFANERQRASTTWTPTLNRHAVLHGEDCEYDTRVNSCRAMSFFAYVCWALDYGAAS
jgi:hypothetical protein